MKKQVLDVSTTDQPNQHVLGKEESIFDEIIIDDPHGPNAFGGQSDQQTQEQMEKIYEVMKMSEDGKPVFCLEGRKDGEKELTPSAPVQNNFTLPEPEDMVDIGVEFNLKTNMVILKVGSKKIAFTIQSARNLALALRQSANMVEKHAN